jgi:cytochrome c
MKHKPFIFMLMVVFMLGLWLHWSSIEKGERLAVENCGGCHDLSAEKTNKRGPYLWGIVNRRAGIADGFEYSEAFRQFADSRQYIWSEINLDLLITDPDKLIPGTRMAERESDSKHAKAFENMQKIDNRKELIVFLKTLN